MKLSVFILHSTNKYLIILFLVVAINNEYLLFGFIKGNLITHSLPFKAQPCVNVLFVIIENSSIETTSKFVFNLSVSFKESFKETYNELFKSKVSFKVLSTVLLLIIFFSNNSIE